MTANLVGDGRRVGRGCELVDLLDAVEADRLLGTAVDRFLGALSVADQPAPRDHGAIDRSLRYASGVRDVDADDVAATSGCRTRNLEPSGGKVVYLTCLVTLREFRGRAHG